jgi:hypothetical protein
MASKPKMIIAHPNCKSTGSRLIVSITPATVEKDGCLTLRLQKQVEWQHRWDIVNESVINLNHIGIAKFIAVLHGYEESIDDGKGIWYRTEESYCRAHFRHMIEPAPGYTLTIDNGKGPVSIHLNTYEAIALCEVMPIALYRAAFG